MFPPDVLALTLCTKNWQVQVHLMENLFFLRLGLINYSQEKDLNNLVATRKHQKNPEKSNIIRNQSKVLQNQ